MTTFSNNYLPSLNYIGLGDLFTTPEIDLNFALSFSLNGFILFLVVIMKILYFLCN